MFIGLAWAAGAAEAGAATATAATTRSRSVVRIGFTIFLSCRVVATGSAGNGRRRRAGACVPAAGEQRNRSVRCCEADEAVDDARGRVCLAELEPEHGGHEIELGDCDEAPVEPADEHQCRGESVHLLHFVHLLSRNCPRTEGTVPTKTNAVKILFNSCTVPSVDGTLRIGELSRRSGVSPELLRAWERRYGLLRPLRSSGGLRLYSSDDVDRVRLMREHMAGGLAAAEAAALAAGAAEGARD